MKFAHAHWCTEYFSSETKSKFPPKKLASRGGSSADTDVEKEIEVSEKFTTLPKGERSELKREKIDVLVKAAFGAIMLESDRGTRETPWCKRWEKVTNPAEGTMILHYDVPGG